MQVEHFILARDSSIDAEKNSLSVFDLIEEIHIQSPGNGPIPFYIQALAILKRDQEAGEVNTRLVIKVLRPDGEVLFNQILPVAMQKEHRRFRIRFNLPFPITMTGEYRFSAHLEGTQKTRRELGVFINHQLTTPPAQVQ